MLMNSEMHDTYDGAPVIEDPIAPDDVLDPVVVTTRRAISRVVHVAAETASRFEREAIPFDPVAWMLSPRRLFVGEAAIDACMRLEDFQRAILLHGLSLGLDADPRDIDSLSGDEDDGEAVDGGMVYGRFTPSGSSGFPADGWPGSKGRVSMPDFAVGVPSERGKASTSLTASAEGRCRSTTSIRRKYGDCFELVLDS